MTWEDARDLADRIDEAAKSYDTPGATEGCDELVRRLNETSAVFPEKSAKRILGTLRRKRYFDELARVTDAFLRAGQNGLQIRRQCAQALLDQGRVVAAIPFLESLASDAAKEEDENEFREAMGLLGRGYKQIYVDAASAAGADAPPTDRERHHLNRSISCYGVIYDEDDTQHWHGCNIVALLARAQRDEVEVDGTPDLGGRVQEQARKILDAIEEKWDLGTATLWDSATAVEMAVALDDEDEAVTWLQRYVSEPRADAFELSSTHRQFREVWQLDSTSSIGASVLSILEAEGMRREGFTLGIPGSALDAAAQPEASERLEKILGKTRYMSFRDMQRAFSCARAVGRIEDQPDHGFGTGFLIRGGDLWEALGDEQVLLTNSHVVSNDPTLTSPPPLMPDEAAVTFQALQEELGIPHEYRASKLYWTSPPGRHDASILGLEQPVEGIETYRIAKRLPLSDGEQRVYIIGHPRGGGLSFSIQDNLLIDHEGPSAGVPEIKGVVRIHYRAPTEGGSSGSPIFNRQWKLIGIHHAGSLDMPRLNGQPGHYAANEGIWIHSIIEAMKADPQQLPS